jgi:hypothetical protein
MPRKISVLLAFFLVSFISISAAKKKDKSLPQIILKAESAIVIIEPDAREPLLDPAANRKTQEEIEKALLRWHRFRLVTETEAADLVIAVRKGTGKAANSTISGGPVDTRPVILESTENQIRVGAIHGRPPGDSQTQDATQQTPAQQGGRAHPGMEVGATDDSLKVFEGGQGYSSGSSPIWTYSAKNALRPPDVTAVAELRKAIEEAEKAQKTQTPAPSSTPPPKTP